VALITSDSTCAICRTGLDRPYIATSGTVDVEPRLLEFCDAPLHLDCLATWPDRVALARAYFEAEIEHHAVPPCAILHRGTDVALVAGESLPGATPYYVTVCLRDWPLALGARWHGWAGFVGGEFDAGLSGEALAAVASAMRVVRALAPDLAALEALHRRWQRSVDWTDVGRRREEAERQADAARREALRVLLAHNEACQRLAERLIRSELACPRCGRSRDIEFVDRSPAGKSCFVCRQCARSFFPRDVTG
jgi:hypothetical protein